MKKGLTPFSREDSKVGDILIIGGERKYIVSYKPQLQEMKKRMWVMAKHMRSGMELHVIQDVLQDGDVYIDRRNWLHRLKDFILCR